MKRTDRKMRLCATLLVANILFIWGNSMLPGSVSGAISGWVRDIILLLLPGGNVGSGTGHGLLRKAAHFTEFACLGALLAWLFSMLDKPVVLALLCAAAVAGIDETIQYFIPDRGPGIKDVLLDTAGALAGITLVLLRCAFLKKSRKRVLEDTTT